MGCDLDQAILVRIESGRLCIDHQTNLLVSSAGPELLDMIPVVQCAQYSEARLTFKHLGQCFALKLIVCERRSHRACQAGKKA
ncbi:hypothetical protein IP65_20250 [Novosphingobium sp. AAP1]|nr:hypothetical protein IP65_20250 [Novosphingobium sp. AAP1]